MLLIWKKYPNSKFARAAFFFGVFIFIPYTAMCLTILRTHYIIDETTGLACGFLFMILAEKICFIPDVLLMGIKAKDRALYFHKACPACGWSNWQPLRYIDDDEKLSQASVLDPATHKRYLSKLEEGHVELCESAHDLVVDIEGQSLVEFVWLDPCDRLAHDLDAIVASLD